MTDNGPITVEVVRGEMQPWSDYEGARRPVGGSVIRALLEDLLPEAARAIVVGPHGSDLIDAVASRSAHVTVLVRSVSDAMALTEQVRSTNLTVFAGALDGFTDRGDPGFDVVLAADGLDRVLGTDSEDLNWPQRLSALARLVAADGVLVLGCENEFALTGLLDRRPPDLRHGDDEWRPIHDDPDRPTSPTQLSDALGHVGLNPTARYAVFDVQGTPHALMECAAAAATRPGRLPARLAVRALEASAASTPLLAPVADTADAATRAGLLDAVSAGWLAVCGARARTLYAQSDAADAVLSADLDRRGWQIRVSGGGEVAGDSADVIAFSAKTVPDVVPDTESVERVLFRLAAAEDVPGFRGVAARLGQWARGRVAGAGPDLVIRFDDLCVDGDGFAPGVSGWVTTQPASNSELLAAAWHRFQDRLVRGHHRHPWPPWMVGDDLVTAWLAMSGVEATAEVTRRGREIADGIAPATSVDPDVDLRTALADAEAARVKAVELAGHIFGLERTIKFRDQQLRVREAKLRELRYDLRIIRGSRAAKLADFVRKLARIRHPRSFARAVKVRLRRLLKR